MVFLMDFLMMPPFYPEFLYLEKLEIHPRVTTNLVSWTKRWCVTISHFIVITGKVNSMNIYAF